MKNIVTNIRNIIKKQNDSGVTLVELIVTFALLGIFLVAASGVIIYVMRIYYQASGSSNGLQVSTIISNKIVAQIEGSLGPDPKVTKNVIVSEGGIRIDSIYLMDKTGSKVTISASPQTFSDGSQKGMYMNIHYDEVTEHGAVKYKAVDWRFDAKAYMGYTVKELTFDDPGADYPSNVVKMTLVLHSDRYGDYTTTSYIKCVNAERIDFPVEGGTG